MTVITDVLEFWFDELGPESWFAGSPSADFLVCDRFRPVHAAAAGGACDAWAETADGALALVIVLDQFSRQLYRGTARAFACDPPARRTADLAIAGGFDLVLPDERRQFLYMPFMHGEDMADQNRCVQLGEERIAVETFLDYAVRHREIIARFGRFPHRNAALGRPNTAAEAAFLQTPNSSF